MPRTSQSRPKTKRQIVSEFRRAEILDAARSVFARKGFALGIMDEIAHEAGIAKGTIYLYFRSKTEVYRALLDHDMRILQQSTLKRIDAAPTLKEKIHAFLLVRLENADEKREIFRIMDSERTNLSMTRRQYRDFLSEPVDRLAAAIEEAAKRGQIHPIDAEKAAWLIADATRGTIQRRLLSQTPPPPATDATFLLDFLWTSLAAKKTR
jgi:TetR/AcrR family transcriptional regulator of autoinduction and epiphytic fitness